jgi:WhiB family transcriptional regulator, redox-sensing transcriptional regulator
MINAALGATFITEAIRADELEWQVGGLCRKMDPEFFFPEGKGSSNQARIAKKICLECPIMRECRNWALSRGEEFGVWGGLSDSDRRAIRKKLGL